MVFKQLGGYAPVPLPGCALQRSVLDFLRGRRREYPENGRFENPDVFFQILNSSLGGARLRRAVTFYLQFSSAFISAD
jgi:hypothetical protein